MKIRSYLLFFLSSLALYAMEEIQVIEVEEDPQFIGEQLKAAITDGNVGVVTVLLSDIKDINAFGKDVGIERPPLSYAALHGKSKIVKLLLDKGADIAVTDEFFDTPLHDAVQWSQGLVIQHLLERKAPINARNRWLQTPLLTALDQDTPSYGIVELLLQYHADPNLPDEHGDTAAHYAYQKGRNDIIELLKNYKAKLDQKNARGEKPIDLKPESEDEESLADEWESSSEVDSPKNIRLISPPRVGITTTYASLDDALGYFYDDKHQKSSLQTHYYLFEAEKVKNNEGDEDDLGYLLEKMENSVRKLEESLTEIT